MLWWNTVYVLTDQRVVEREGVVRRFGHDLPLSGVTDVVVAQRLSDRVLGCGTLTVTTEGGTEFTVRDVPAVAVVQRSLLAVVDDVEQRLTSPRRLPRAELGEPGFDDGLDDGLHDGLHDGLDDGIDDGRPPRGLRRRARRRGRRHGPARVAGGSQA